MTLICRRLKDAAGAPAVNCPLDDRFPKKADKAGSRGGRQLGIRIRHSQFIRRTVGPGARRRWFIDSLNSKGLGVLARSSCLVIQGPQMAPRLQIALGVVQGL